MRIVTLLENTACREGLSFEHGLSLYIETGSRRILFDAGQSGAFADNAEKLGIDLKTVDFAVLSHGHYDHGGGMERFLEINDKAPVYVNRNAFTPCFNASGRYIGLSEPLRSSPRLVFTEDTLEIAPGITLHSCNGLPSPFPTDSSGLTAGETRKPDAFLHEQYLLIEEGGRRICSSGCSHKGILNIVHWLNPDVLVGGFHFMKVEDEAFLTEAARRLLESPTTYYTGHCTGGRQFAVMKKVMGSRLLALSGGETVIL